jgi:transcriptional regulator with XRE-family HTH domain
MSQPQDFGPTLKRWRTEAGLSLQQLGDRVGMSATNLSRIERGLIPPPASDVLDRLAEALEAPAHLLYDAAGRLPSATDERGQAEALGRVIRQAREHAGLTLRDVQDAIGLSIVNLSRIERGLVAPPPNFILDKVARAIGTPRSTLYTAAGRVPPSADEPVDAVEAIMADPDLDDDLKASLARIVTALKEQPRASSFVPGVAQSGTAMPRLGHGDPEPPEREAAPSAESAADERRGR